HQRGLPTRVGQHRRADGRHEGLRAGTAARRRGSAEVHRGAGHRRAADAAPPARFDVVRDVREGVRDRTPRVATNGSAMTTYDVCVIGSGFGGSVAALRLTEKGYRVGVLEAGARFDDHDFPETSWDLRRFLFAPSLGCFGIQRIGLLRDVMVLAGAGVGGGSLVYANT